MKLNNFSLALLLIVGAFLFNSISMDVDKHIKLVEEVLKSEGLMIRWSK